MNEELIKTYKDTIIAAFNFYLDYIYNLTDDYFEGDNLKPEFSSDKKLEELLKSCRANAEKYEKVRKKLSNGDFNLSLVEINYIGLMLFFWSATTQNHIETLRRAVEEADKLRSQLLGEDFDESQAIDILNFEEVN